jgi:hypothetical protein
MKKVCVILVALLLLVGMSLSAQGKWTNWGEGIMYPFYKVGSADAGAGWGPVDWGTDLGPVTGQYNEWTFAYDGDNIGAYWVLAFDGKEFADLLVNPMQRFAIYFNFGSMVKATFGAPRVSDYRPATFIEGNHTGRVDDGDYAGMLQVMPIEGLSAGALLFIPNDPQPWAAPDWGKAFGFGASYVLPNIATLYASARLDNEWVNVSANVTALKDIGLMASFAYDWTDPLDPAEEGDWRMFVLASAKMPVGPLKLALDAGLKTELGTAHDTLGFGANLDGQYALNDKWTLGATVGYDNGAGLVGGGEGTPGVGFSVFPYLKAGFGDSYVKLGFVYASGYDAHGSLSQADAVMAIPIMYVISF